LKALAIGLFRCEVFIIRLYIFGDLCFCYVLLERRNTKASSPKKSNYFIGIFERFESLVFGIDRFIYFLYVSGLLILNG